MSVAELRAEDEGLEARRARRRPLPALERADERLGQRADDRGRGEVGVERRQLLAVDAVADGAGEEVRVRARNVSRSASIAGSTGSAISAYARTGSASARRTNASTQAARRVAGSRGGARQRVDLPLRRPPEHLGEQLLLEVAVDGPVATWDRRATRTDADA